MEPKKPAKPRHKPGEPYKDNRGARPGRTTHTNRGGNLGQEPFVPTDQQREQVREFAAVGLAQQQMIRLIKHPDGRPISVHTLRKYFPEELENGGLAMMADLGGAMWRGAMAGNAQLMRLCWNIHAHRFGLNKEGMEHRHTGTVNVVDWGPVIEATPPEARAALLEQIEKQIQQAAENAGTADEDTDEPE